MWWEYEGYRCQAHCSDHAALVSHQSKLTASSSIQDGHQLKPVELNIVLWYIYILKLDLIILGA